jgi:hypothetical protein
MTTTTDSAAVTPDAPAKHSWLPLLVTGIVLLLCAGIYLRIRAHTEDPGERMPTRFVFAPGVTGNIRINYEIDGAPPLPIVDGHRLVRVPIGGRVDTSSPMLYGTAPDEYFREQPDGTLEPLDIHALALRKNGLAGDKNEFFSSTSELLTRDELLAAHGLLGPDGQPQLGPPYELLVIRDGYK